MKPQTKKDNRRLDVKSLHKRYDNSATQDQYINKAKRTLESTTYRNERAMKFENFVAKFIKAVDHLEIFNCGIHNVDVVDLIL